MKNVELRVSSALLLVVGFACSSNPDDTTMTSAPSARPFVRPANMSTTFGTTTQLVTDPLTRDKVEALHALTLKEGIILDPAAEHGYRLGLVPTVDGKETGVGGDSGPEWLAFHDLETTVSPTDAEALLRHEDPAIRVYFIWHASAATGTDLANLLYPMLADNTNVHARYGCTGQTETVADQAMDKLEIGSNDGRDRAHPDVLTAVVTDDRILAHTRGIALRALVLADPAAALPLAKAAARSSSSDWKHEGITVLGTIATSNDLDLIAAESTSGDFNDRENAAHALGRVDAVQSRNLLEPLLKDPHAEVIEAAAESYSFQSSASDLVVAELLNRAQESTNRAAGRGLIRRGTLHALEVLEPSLMQQDPRVDSSALGGMISQIGAPAIPILNDLLGSKSDIVRRLAAEQMYAIPSAPSK